MPIVPLKDYLLLKPVEEPPNAAGLYVPDDPDAKIRKGEVVATGPALWGFTLDSSTYRIGEIVLYSKFGANEIREGGTTYYLVQDKEVWAKIGSSSTPG